MPHGPLAETRRILAAAAALRVAGAGWDVIAERLGRSYETVRGWSSRFRALWNELYAAAEKEYMAEVATEARAILRSQLREKSLATKRDAAKIILAHADRHYQPEPDSDRESPRAHAESVPEHEAFELEEDTDGILGPDTTGGSNPESGRALPE